MLCSDIHGIGRVRRKRSHLAVDLDQTLHEDLLDFLLCQRILEAIAEDQDQRQALTELVRTSGRTRGLSQCSEKSMRWNHESIMLTQVPPILSSIQCFGAARRFICFLGPRA